MPRVRMVRLVSAAGRDRAGRRRHMAAIDRLCDREGCLWVDADQVEGGWMAYEASGRRRTLVGFVAHRKTHVTRLLVASKRRGRGIGTRLLSAAVDDMAASGVDVVRVDPVDDAHAFYARFGFRSDPDCHNTMTLDV